MSECSHWCASEDPFGPFFVGRHGSGFGPGTTWWGDEGRARSRCAIRQPTYSLHDTMRRRHPARVSPYGLAPSKIQCGLVEVLNKIKAKLHVTAVATRQVLPQNVFCVRVSRPWLCVPSRSVCPATQTKRSMFTKVFVRAYVALARAGLALACACN